MAIRVQGTTIIDDSRNFTNMESLNGVPISVTKPSITSPVNGSQTLESTITFQSSDFAVNLDTDTHVSSDWELATDSGFSNIVASTTDDTSNLTSFTVSNLSVDTYFVRVRHSGATLGDSEYSDAVSFSIIEQIAYMWGINYAAMLGDGSLTNRSSPVTVVGGISDWTDLSSGGIFSHAIRSNGVLYGWGRQEDFGNIGDGTNIDRSSPVTVLGGFTDWEKISNGREHSLALRSNGVLYAWGRNTDGVLGDGTITNRISPVTVIGGITDWTNFSGGDTHSLALRSNGVLYGWGNNNIGILGVGFIGDVSSPATIVGGFTDWIEIEAGENISFGIRSNGVLYGWGNSVVGDGTSTFRDSPVTVLGGFTDWEKISASDFVLGLRSNGDLYAWGSNVGGQLGDGTTTERLSPVLVIGGITDWTDTVVSTGQGTSYALRSNGVLYSWGNNGSGELGDGTTTNRSSPVTVVGGITDWTSITAGNSTGGGLVAQ